MVFPGPAEGQSADPSSPIDTLLARRYFAEAKAIADADGGRLWGMRLGGPLLLADPASRAVVASEADGEGLLAPQGSIHLGTLPATESIANTAANWAGRRWTMLVWPLPADRALRAELMAHELWHRVQDSIGLPSNDALNPHLDTPGGRTWLRLEAKALQAALAADGQETRRRAVADALAFRAHRRSLVPGADSTERALEMHEGLAAYTGLALSGRDDGAMAARARALLDEMAAQPSYVRSFAYGTGPAYGVLLDRTDRVWRRGLTPSSELGAMLAAALGVRPEPRMAAAAIVRRAAPYGYTEIAQDETARGERRRERRVALTTRFVTGPVLRLPLRKMQLQFDPNRLEPLDTAGTVYGTIRVADRWGVLDATHGALVSADWQSLTVPSPASATGRVLEGDGWRLELAEGWTVAAGERPGDYRITSPAE